MSKLTERLAGARQAWGTTFAAAPPIKETQQHVREWFEAGEDEAEVRSRLRAQMIDDKDLGLRVFLGLNRKTMRYSAAKAVVALAKQYADKIGSKHIETLLTEWAESAGVLDWMADYHIAWYTTGVAPAMGQQLFGGVATLRIGQKDDQTPIVMAMAGPASDPEAIIEQFREACYREFPDAFARKEHAERDAERFRLHHEGLTDFDIARRELEAEGWPWTAASKAEYNWGVESRANAVWYARKRWLEHLANTADPVPINSK